MVLFVDVRILQKKNPKQNPREKRLEALQILLDLERPTSKAIPYSDYENKPKVIYNK